MPRRRTSLLIILTFLLIAVSASGAQANTQLIVHQRTGATQRALTSALRSVHALRLNAPSHLAQDSVISVPGNGQAVLKSLAADAPVGWVEVNKQVQTATTTFTDPWYSYQWALNNTGAVNFGTTLGSYPGTPGDDIDAEQAWDISEGSGVEVGVVDTGADLDQEDLAGQFALGGYNWIAEDNDPSDDDGHGTHVSGIIAAIGGNNVGIVGVAPKAQLVELKALDSTGSGSIGNVAAAFDYAGDMGLPIVNASLGVTGEDPVIDQAIAAHPNTLYVVAAGNASTDNDNTPESPCTSPEANVLCVGASDGNDDMASFSNYGASTVDVFAPGVGIVSDYDTAPDSMAVASGTSMATPMVSGIAADVLSAYPTMSTAELKADIMDSVDYRASLAPYCISGGRVNAFNALEIAPEILAGTYPPAPATTTPAPTPTSTPTSTPASTPTSTPPSSTTTPVPTTPLTTPITTPNLTPTTTPAPTPITAPVLSPRPVTMPLAQLTHLATVINVCRHNCYSRTVTIHFKANHILQVTIEIARRNGKPGHYHWRLVRHNVRVTHGQAHWKGSLVLGQYRYRASAGTGSDQRLTSYHFLAIRR